MKIGIITFWNSQDNYGQLLQCWALQSYLKKLGHTPFLIRFISEKKQKRILDENGVVFGARFDGNWEVVHDYVETKEGLALFRGSKYVQSRIGETYLQARQFLKEGRKVLFSGTPCQIAGLKLFLGKEYDNLLTVDIVCHGVPSLKIWQSYLQELRTKNREQEQFVTFRDKSTGWGSYSFKIIYATKEFKELSSKNIFMKGF